MTFTTVSVLPVRSAEEHAQATVYLREMMDAPDAELRAAELQAQASLIEAYERKHFLIPAPDAVTAIRFRMEQEGLDRGDLSDVLGVARGRVSELLSGKRQMTVAMLRALHLNWGIPAATLLGSVGRVRTPRSVTRPRRTRVSGSAASAKR